MNYQIYYKQTVLLILFYTSLIAFGQKTNFPDSNSISVRKSLYSINMDYISISLRYEAKISNKWYGGAEVLFGRGYRIVLGKSIKAYSYQDNEYTDGYARAIFESRKISICFSNYLKKNIYQSIGIYGSISSPGEGDNFLSIGTEYSFFYGFNKIKFGHKLQIGIAMLRNEGNNYNGLYGGLVPIIVQFKF